MENFFPVLESLKKLIWCTNDSNVHIRIFRKRWSLILGCFFPVSLKISLRRVIHTLLIFWYAPFYYCISQIFTLNFLNKKKQNGRYRSDINLHSIFFLKKCPYKWTKNCFNKAFCVFISCLGPLNMRESYFLAEIFVKLSYHI